MRSKFIYFLALISFAFLITIKGCGFQETATLKPFKVGMNSWPGYQIALYAETAGIFKKHGLAVEFVRFMNQQDNIRATMRGAQDASFVPLSEVMQVDPTQEKPVFVLVVDVSAGSDGIAALPKITSVKDLKGKKVSAKLSTVSHLILLEALKANQLKSQDVEIIDVSNERGAELLKKGTISAAVLWEPILHDTAQAVGGKVIHTTADLDSLVIDGLTTRSSLLTTKQDELVNFIQAWFEVMEAIDQNSSEVFAAVAQKLGMTPEAFAEDYKGLKKGDLAMNRRMFAEGRLQEVYQQTQKILSDDLRHGRIIREDIKIDAEPIVKATRNWQS
ncbi:MAG: ABC transporter substrate-binding protein [Leptolyngbyaceae bacterium]|nr:ABC transporter substrate-binding protein [Leptolyngbyaceae bacterium]